MRWLWNMIMKIQKERILTVIWQLSWNWKSKWHANQKNVNDKSFFFVNWLVIITAFYLIYNLYWFWLLSLKTFIIVIISTFSCIIITFCHYNLPKHNYNWVSQQCNLLIKILFKLLLYHDSSWSETWVQVWLVNFSSFPSIGRCQQDAIYQCKQHIVIFLWFILQWMF